MPLGNPMLRGGLFSQFGPPRQEPPRSQLFQQGGQQSQFGQLAPLLSMLAQRGRQQRPFDLGVGGGLFGGLSGGGGSGGYTGPTVAP